MSALLDFSMFWAGGTKALAHKEGGWWELMKMGHDLLHHERTLCMKSNSSEFQYRRSRRRPQSHFSINMWGRDKSAECCELASELVGSQLFDCALNGVALNIWVLIRVSPHLQVRMEWRILATDFRAYVETPIG